MARFRTAGVRDMPGHEDAFRLAAIVNSSDDAIIGKSLDGLIESWNRGAEKIYGYSAEEAVGQSISLLVPSDHADEVPGLLEQIRRDERVDHYETVRQRKDGALIDVSLTISPIKDVRGNITGASTITRDITERKRVEEKLHGLLESAADAVLIANEDGEIVLANKRACELFGYVKDELVGRPVEFLIPERFRDHHQGSRTRFFADSRVRPMGAGLDLWAVRKDGTEFPVDISLSHFEPREGAFVSAAIVDITARKKKEEELNRLAEELAQSNSELENYASLASHDLQEPLRKIQAFADRLKTREAERVTDQGRDYLERIDSAARRMQVLIDSLLAYSRVTREAKPFTSCDLDEVAGEVLSDLELSIHQVGARVEIGDLPTIEADPAGMHRLLQNLVGNSLKFARADKPPTVRIYGRVLSRDGERSPDDFAACEIFVEDNGIGFEEKYVDRIFTIFQRLHSRGDYEGVGMGLAICKKIAKRHGGDVTAKSTPGEGSTFIVTLPVRQTRGRLTE